MKYFDMVFQKYDDLNASVQENVSSIRVVKAYVREDYEKVRALGLSYRKMNKLIGNSIIVPILEKIFKQMMKEMEN